MFSLAKEALRIYKRARRVKKYGVKKYKGNADEICHQIIKDCWNGKYFYASTGHYKEFWIRDFGLSVESLVKAGYKDKAIKTLEFVLNIYSKQKLTTTITPDLKCIDIYTYSPDSLAFLLMSIRILKPSLAKKYKIFLEAEIKKFEETAFDSETGMIKKKHFSSMKDSKKRKSSCYNNLMLEKISQEIDRLKLPNPFATFYIKTKIKSEFWNGRYFYDDLDKRPIVTGDSNFFPFWLEIFKDKKMFKQAISSIIKSNLDKPFPLKYSGKYGSDTVFWVKLFSNGYQKDSVWTNIGPLYIHSVKKINKNLAQQYKQKYKALIEKHKNFLEVFKRTKPFETAFYYCDEGMLWCANYLTI